MAISPLPTALTGQWTNLYESSGIAVGSPMLVYVDGGNAAFAVTSGSTPDNRQFSTEAKSGYQVSVSGGAGEVVWARATTGGSAEIRIQEAAGNTIENNPVSVSASSSANDSFSNQGTISAVSQTVELDAPGAASGIITIEGDFIGVIELTGGTILGNSVEGGRLLFRSGVGSIGRNIVVSDSAGNKAQEFRFVAGGEKVIARATSWTSGSCDVRIFASKSPNTVFVIGPVKTAEQEATRDARAYSAPTGVQSVQAGNVLAVALKNPSDSNVNMILARRKFSNNRGMTDVNLEYFAIGNPISNLANSGSGLSLRVNSGAVSTAVFEWEVGDAATLGNLGGFLGTGEVLPNGIPYSRDFEVVFPPGTGFGVIIQGAGNNILQAVRVGVILEWYEEAVI